MREAQAQIKAPRAAVHVLHLEVAYVSNSKLKGSKPCEIIIEEATPLHIACDYNNGKIGRALISNADKPVSHLAFDSYGRTPCKVAVGAGAQFACDEIEGLMPNSDISSLVHVHH